MTPKARAIVTRWRFKLQNQLERQKIQEILDNAAAYRSEFEATVPIPIMNARQQSILQAFLDSNMVGDNADVFAILSRTNIDVDSDLEMDGYLIGVLPSSSSSGPTAPSGLSVSIVSESELSLSWTDNSSTETAFSIERSLDGSTGWTVVQTTAANVTSWNDTGLSASTSYYYRVRAYDGSTYSAYTSTANAKTAPAVPTGFSATADPADAAQIDLAWTDASSDETGFRIERSLNGTSGWTLVTTTAAGATSYTDTGLTAETTYYYRIRAERSGDGATSTWSGNTSATTISLQDEYFYYMENTIVPNLFVRLTESSGSVADNTGSSGATLDGTFVGAAHTLNVTTSPPGNFKQYVDWDGSDGGYLEFLDDPSNLGSNSDDWTIGIVLRPDAFSGINLEARFIVKGFNWFVRYQITEKLDIKVDAATDMTWIDNTGNLIDQTWQYLFFVIEGGTNISVYRGVGSTLTELTAGAESAGALPMANPTTDLRIMNRVGTADKGLDGGLASFFVYQGLLSTADMNTILDKSGI